VYFATRGNGGGRDGENLSPPNSEIDEELHNEEILFGLEKDITEPQTTEVDFTIYPNPNDGNFTVKITGNIEPYTVEIFNAMGVLIGNVDCYEETIQINQANLPAGIYYVRILVVH